MDSCGLIYEAILQICRDRAKGAALSNQNREELIIDKRRWETAYDSMHQDELYKSERG